MSFAPGRYPKPIAGRMPQGRSADGTWCTAADLAEEPPAIQAAADLLASLAYELGRHDGRREVLCEQSSAEAVRVVRRLAALPSQVERWELRGRPDIAQRIRAEQAARYAS